MFPVICTFHISFVLYQQIIRGTLRKHCSLITSQLSAGVNALDT